MEKGYNIQKELEYLYQLAIKNKTDTYVQNMAGECNSYYKEVPQSENNMVCREYDFDIPIKLQEMLQNLWEHGNTISDKKEFIKIVTVLAFKLKKDNYISENGITEAEDLPHYTYNF